MTCPPSRRSSSHCARDPNAESTRRRPRCLVVLVVQDLRSELALPIGSVPVMRCRLQNVDVGIRRHLKHEARAILRQAALQIITVEFVSRNRPGRYPSIPRRRTWPKDGVPSDQSVHPHILADLLYHERAWQVQRRGCVFVDYCSLGKGRGGLGWGQ